MAIKIRNTERKSLCNHLLVEIKKMMFDKHVTTSDMCDALKVNPSTFSRLMNGEIQMTIARLDVIAERLYTTASALLGRAEV